MTSFDMTLVDEIRKRIDANYDEALWGLEEGEGDLLRALAAIERRRSEDRRAEESGELVGRAIALAKEGRLKGLRLVLGDRPLRELPLPRGFGGALIGELITAVISQLKVELVEQESPAAQPEEDETEFPGEDEE